ncbi:MAG: alkyl hydroperoxide reductase [Gemmataceae bacterium]
MPVVPSWMRWTLVLAGIYNLVWGTWVIVWPAWSFRLGGLHTAAHETSDPGLYLHLWQCIGMIVGVYGVGYLAASRDPCRHWPIVLVGFLGKLFGPIGAMEGALAGRLPWSILWTNLTNDLIWLIPFAWILLEARRQAGASS